jgi:hypothetical protein
MVLTERWSRREALRGREGAAEQNGRGDPTAPPEGDAENDGGGHAFSVEQRRKEREKKIHADRISSSLRLIDATYVLPKLYSAARPNVASFLFLRPSLLLRRHLWWRGSNGLGLCLGCIE